MRKIVIDTLGGDRGAEAVLQGSARALLDNSSFSAVFVGDEALCRSVMDENGVDSSRYTVIHTTDFITNEEPPVCIYGGRDTSSMALALGAAKDDCECVGMLSAGNTGALLVGSMCRLGLFKGVRQPALASALPLAGGRYVCITDCGANIDCKARELVTFAKMGDAFMRGMYSVESPRIGLLSVGSEEGKGNALTKEAFSLLRETDLNFIGNIEGSDVVCAACDVVVTDGFAGNVLLKNIEAVGKYAAGVASALLEGDESERVGREVYEHFDFNARGGALFLGTVKPIVKMHGAAEQRTVSSCIEMLLALDDGGFIEKTEKALC